MLNNMGRWKSSRLVYYVCLVCCRLVTSIGNWFVQVVEKVRKEESLLIVMQEQINNSVEATVLPQFRPPYSNIRFQIF